jgi:hypothetical protein
MREQRTQYGRFAGTDFAGDFDKAGPGFNTVDKMRVDFVMCFAEEKEARIWCQGKRFFLEGKKRFIHKSDFPRALAKTLLDDYLLP